MRPISWPKCDPTPDGSSKVAEVKVIMWYFKLTTSFVLFFIVLVSPPSGGFQGIPSSLRQPAPRSNLRQMTPNSGMQGPRGVFSYLSLYHHLIHSGVLLF